MKIIFILLLPLFCFAQQEKKVDSLITIANKLTTVKEKFDYLCSIPNKERYATHTINYIKEAEQIAIDNDNEDYIALTYYYYANYYYYNAKLDSSLFYIKKAKPFLSPTRQPLVNASLISTEGGVYQKKGNMPLSISKTLESQQLLDKIDTIPLTGEERRRYKMMGLSTLNSLANYYNSIDEYEKAISFYDKGYSTALRNNLYMFAGVFINNKGDVFLKKNQFKNALDAFLEGKKLKKKGNAQERIIKNSDLNIGVAYTGLNENQMALPYLEDVVAFYKKNNITTMLAESLFYKGNLYLNIQDYKNAKADCEEAKTIAIADSNLEVVKKACNCLYQGYKATLDYDLALENHELYLKTKDSIFNEKNIKKQTEQELQYEFNKTEELRSAQIKAKENESKLYSILAAVAFTFALFLGFFFYKNRKKNILLAKQKNLLEATVDEKNILLRETHHRVKNSFQMVSSLLFIQSETAQDAEAKIAIKEAQNRVRSMVLIHQKLYSKNKLVGIDSKEYIEDFTKDVIESHQFETTKLKYKVDAQSLLLDIETITPLGLILNELITNVLKHAFHPVTENSLLHISFKKQAATLVLTVTDNGKGMPPKVKDSSFGLQLIEGLCKKLKATLTLLPASPKGTEAKVVMMRFEIL
ncbi:hypothetical protein ULMS_07170 [Patiriisocius marinistellae]|uniref:histidine kinase n=1 Tax=Patiriisocius marinistellae TaxID=2494560 RepID=A0A5J4FYG8_9FLAO|nr:sensor histidine kinase [Patiriisocius marinistellae]GEQ85209.1 hypothetical protein ULMS_07170 [Patiriisocius marinistellae]